MVLGITSVNQNQITQFVSETGITYPIIQDESTGGGFGGFGGVVYDDYYIPNQGSPYPRDFIIAQNGNLQYANNEIDTEWMHYVLDELMGGNCADWSLGDVNQDMIINILDIVNLVNYILATVTPTECEFYAGDINDDGVLNILDIVQLVNQILNP